MNCKCCCKTFLKPIILGLIFVFVFEWLWHGKIMADIYMATADIWRTQAESMSMMYLLVVAQLLTVTLLTYIFSKGVENKGCTEGVRYGAIIALLYIAMSLYAYIFQPIPLNVIVWWCAGYLIEFPLLGLIIAKTYDNKKV